MHFNKELDQINQSKRANEQSALTNDQCETKAPIPKK